MQIVIDISKEDYKNVSRIVDMGLGTNVDEAIKNGTPLNDVVDKIRTEIASYGTNSGMLLALEIIDKYRGEDE